MKKIRHLCNSAQSPIYPFRPFKQMNVQLDDSKSLMKVKQPWLQLDTFKSTPPSTFLAHFLAHSLRIHCKLLFTHSVKPLNSHGLSVASSALTLAVTWSRYCLCLAMVASCWLLLQTAPCSARLSISEAFKVFANESFGCLVSMIAEKTKCWRVD